MTDWATPAKVKIRLGKQGKSANDPDIIEWISVAHNEIEGILREEFGITASTIIGTTTGYDRLVDCEADIAAGLFSECNPNKTETVEVGAPQRDIKYMRGMRGIRSWATAQGKDADNLSDATLHHGRSELSGSRDYWDTWEGY